MDDTPKPLDLEAIKARCEAATEGPWTWSGRTDDLQLRGSYSDNGRRIPVLVMTFIRKGMRGAQPTFLRRLSDGFLLAPATEFVVRQHEQTASVKDVDHPDARFIAHARTDIPALVAEVERLRDALKVYADEENWGSYHIHDTDEPTDSLDVWVHAPSENYGPSVAKLALGEDQ